MHLLQYLEVVEDDIVDIEEDEFEELIIVVQGQQRIDEDYDEQGLIIDAMLQIIEDEDDELDAIVYWGVIDANELLIFVIFLENLLLLDEMSATYVIDYVYIDF